MPYVRAQSATDNLDLLDQLVEFLEGQSVESLVIAGGGTGYAVDDVLTVSGGTSTIAVELIVTSESSGVIDGVRISQSGVYTSVPSNDVSVTGGSGSGATFTLTWSSAGDWVINRRTQEAVSAAIGAGGTGYAVNDQLTVVGGVDVDTAAVFNVDSVSGGVVTAVSLVTAGKYGEVPSNDVATTNDGAGNDDCELTVTWQNHTSTNFDVLFRNNTTNSWYGGIRGYTSGSARNWELRGATGYTAANPWGTQPGISPGDYEAATSSARQGCYVPLDNSAITYWFYKDDRHVKGVMKVGASTYTNFFMGFVDQFGTDTDMPYPLLIVGCSSEYTRLFSSNDTGYSGMCDPISDDSHDTAGPAVFRTPGGTWTQVHNSQGNGASRSSKTAFVIFPCGELEVGSLSADDEWSNAVITASDFIPNTGAPGTPTYQFKQTPESPEEIGLPWPAILLQGTPREAHGEMPGVFWISADMDGQSAVAASEDTITDPATGDVYDIFQNVNRTELFTYFALKHQ